MFTIGSIGLGIVKPPVVGAGLVWLAFVGVSVFGVTPGIAFLGANGEAILVI